MPMPNRKLGNFPIESLIWSGVCSLSQSTVHHVLEDCRWRDYTDTWPNNWFKVTKGLIKYILCAPQALKNTTSIQLWMCIRWLHKFTSLLLLHCIPLTLKIGTEYIRFVQHVTMRCLSTCSASSGVTVHKLLGVHDCIDVITSAAEFVYEGRIPLDVSHDGTLLCTCRLLSYLVWVRDLWLSAPPPKYHDVI